MRVPAVLPEAGVGADEAHVFQAADTAKDGAQGDEAPRDRREIPHVDTGTGKAVPTQAKSGNRDLGGLPC